jgi:hypothetical protein
MKAVPLVAGALVLAFALSVLLSLIRVTTIYVFRSAHGEEEFALEVPRGWGYRAIPGTEIEYVLGRLPSGAQGRFALSVYRYATPPGRYPDAPPTHTEKADEIREEWTEGGWRRTVIAELRSSPRDEVMTLTGRIERGDVTFSATAFGPDPLRGQDLKLLDRCVRSLRWIGR